MHLKILCISHGQLTSQREIQHPTVTEWPTYSPNSRTVMRFADHTEITHDPWPSARKSWEEFDKPNGATHAPKCISSAVEKFIERHFSYLTDPICRITYHSRRSNSCKFSSSRRQSFRYASKRNEVLPISSRSKPTHRISAMVSCNFPVWNHVETAPSKIRQNFVMSCCTRICTPLVCGSRRENKAPLKKKLEVQTGNGWDRTLPCINLAVEELETHGWLVNQTRMWLSDWTVRHGQIGGKEKTAFSAPH